MRHNIIIVAVTMAATLLISCKSKEAVTKETTVTNKEQQTATKDSITHSSVIVKSDTTYSNEETVIHKTVYDTSKTDSNGKHPVLSTTDIMKKKLSGSKGRKEQTSIFTKVQNTDQSYKQKITDKKKSFQKIVSPVDKISSMIRILLLSILLIVISFFIVKYRNVISKYMNKIIASLKFGHIH
jgi:hypothetical protein